MFPPLGVRNYIIIIIIIKHFATKVDSSKKIFSFFFSARESRPLFEENEPLRS